MKLNRLYLLTLFFLVWSCSPCEFDEVNRVKSPDRVVDAVHVRGNCGATTSFSENIFIVPNDAKTPPPRKQYQVLAADHVQDLKLKWREPKVLEIYYKEARIFHFSNFWQSKDVQDFSYVVEVRLRPETDDHSLSRRDRWLDMK